MWEEIGRGPLMDNPQTAYERKLAELIVQECVTICAELSDEYREAAKAQRINNEDQTKALFIAQQRMKAILGVKQ